jgi:hypothetical protein
MNITNTLFKRSLASFKKRTDFKPTVAGQTIDVKSKLMLYNNLSYVKHEDGELTYTLHMEFKDAKYRYWLTDFVFTPYQRNRYGVYARVPGAEQPLEQAKVKMDAKVVDNYFEQIAKFGKQIGDDTKNYIITPVKKVAEPAKTDTRKW